MFNTILENFHFEKILTALKNSIVYMIVAGVLTALIAGIFGNSFTYREYCSSVSFYVYYNPDNVNDSGVNQTSSEISAANKLITSYIQVLKSSSFMEAVSEELQMDGYTADRIKRSITTRAMSDAPIFVVYAYDANPANALKLANAVGELAPTLIPSIVKAGGFRVFDAPKLATAPTSSLSRSKIILFGFVGGFAVAFLVCLIIAMLDTTIKRAYEVEDLFTIPILGKVPLKVSKNKKGNSYDEIIVNDDSSFALKEAYNGIRSNLLWSRDEKKCQVFVITSADPSEGKTVNSYNIAKSFSTIGKKVLLIDADMRDSKLRQIVPNKDKNGLADYLEGKTKNVTFVKAGEGFDVVHSSENSSNKTELLSTEKWYSFISEMKEKYDEIIIDMPSLRLFSEPLSMSRTDAYYIIVVREGVTKFVRTKMVVQRLEELNADIIGIIYNGISTKSNDYVFKNYKEKTKEKTKEKNKENTNTKENTKDKTKGNKK